MVDRVFNSVRTARRFEATRFYDKMKKWIF